MTEAEASTSAHTRSCFAQLRFPRHLENFQHRRDLGTQCPIEKSPARATRGNNAARQDVRVEEIGGEFHFWFGCWIVYIGNEIKTTAASTTCVTGRTGAEVQLRLEKSSTPFRVWRHRKSPFPNREVDLAVRRLERSKEDTLKSSKAPSASKGSEESGKENERACRGTAAPTLRPSVLSAQAPSALPARSRTGTAARVAAACPPRPHRPPERAPEVPRPPPS